MKKKEFDQESWWEVDDFQKYPWNKGRKSFPLSFIFYSGVIVWALSKITHHQSGQNYCSSCSKYSLTYIDIQISSCEISNITLTLVYWFLFYLPALIKRRMGCPGPVPHISQMQWGEVAVAQQASPLNLLWVTCLAYDLYTMTFTHFSVKIHWGRMPLIRARARDPSRRLVKEAVSRLRRSRF